MKNFIKYILQSVLGFQNYLYIFSNYKIRTLQTDKKEGDFFHFLTLLKKEKGTILDVGANIGIMTVHLSLNFPKDSILAIEPMPENLSVLNKILRGYKLKNVTVLPVAVGKESGTISMIMPRNGKVRMQGLSHVKCDEITEWNDGEEFDVPLRTIDEIVGDQTVQGIKMDVENYEYPALLGASKLLTEQKPILYLELWDNENRTQCFEFLLSLGYSIKVVDNNQLVDFQAEKHNQQNFIFVSN